MDGWFSTAFFLLVAVSTLHYAVVFYGNMCKNIAAFAVQAAKDAQALRQRD